jgi:uncharacterized membrane protein YkoI
MKAIWTLGIAGGLVFALAAGAAEGQAAKKPAATVKLPPAVAEAFQKAYPDATIEGTSKETEKGKTVYEVESVDKGMNRDLSYAADGTLLECEEQIKPEDLPAAVADAFKKLYPKASITKAERTTEGQTVKYELAVKGAPKREVSFTPDGKPVGPEPKK